MSRIIALIALCLLPFISSGCEKVPLLAPTDSTISVSANTTTLPLNGTAQITAVVLEASGTPPQNGTVVTFTTTLGSINPVEARTTNGLATTTFSAGSRFGTATIRGFSGGAAGGETDSSVDVIVGAGEGGDVLLRVESVSNAGTVHHIVATVLDPDGNRVPGAPVSFSATAGQVNPGFVTADGNGEARTTLTVSSTSTLTASSGAATAGTLQIAAPGSLALARAETTPAEVGQVVNFTVTPTGFFNNVVVDFGDGTPAQNLGGVSAVRTFTHTFNQRGTFIVKATGMTATGETSTAELAVQVNDRGPLSFSITAPTTPVSLASTGGLVAFTVGQPSPTGTVVSRVDWAFGDGTTDRTTALTTTHRYSAANTYTVNITVTATDGRQGNGSVQIRVTP